MKTMGKIEVLAQKYSAAREALGAALTVYEDERRALAKKQLPRLRKLVAEAKAERATLAEAIEDSSELFVKPRTVTLHGVRLGLVKGAGRIEWDDEPAVIARIRRLLPEEQAALLVRVKESVHRAAVYELPASDLKRLGIRIEGGGDEVLIKDAAGEVDKLVAVLLKEDEEVEA